MTIYESKNYWIVLYIDKIGKDHVYLMLDGFKDKHNVRRWYVNLVVSHKKINNVTEYIEQNNCLNVWNLDNTQTGYGSVSGMLLAKMMLHDFITNISTYSDTKDNIVIVEGSDRRRFNIYERFLMDIGFVLSKTNTSLYIKT